MKVHGAPVQLLACHLQIDRLDLATALVLDLDPLHRRAPQGDATLRILLHRDVLPARQLRVDRRVRKHAVVHVQFASTEVALHVVSRTHVINGRKVVVERELTESPEEEEEGWRIYVVCSKYIQEVQLGRFFEEHGEDIANAITTPSRLRCAGVAVAGLVLLTMLFRPDILHTFL